MGQWKNTCHKSNILKFYVEGPTAVQLYELNNGRFIDAPSTPSSSFIIDIVVNSYELSISGG